MILMFSFCCWWLIVLQQPEENLATDMKTSRVPQEYMSNLKVTHFTEAGQIKDHIYADYWAFIPEYKMSTIDKPYLVVIKPDQTIWEVRAAFGRAEQENIGKVSKIELRRQVELTRPAKANTVPIQITTDRVDYFPDDEKLLSDAFVKIEKPGVLMTGTGFNGDLTCNWLELLSDVKTIFTQESA